MGKRNKFSKMVDPKNSKKRRAQDDSFELDRDMDDEIDAFHKQRDVIPLDVEEDFGGTSDEDMEQPVFDFKDEEEDDDDGGDDNDDDEDVDDSQLKGLAAKIARQQKFLRQKIGGVEDETHDDDDDGVDYEERKALWGRRKHLYYNADNIDYEIQSSDEDLPAEEEAEVLRLQKEKAKSLCMEDFGLEDDENEIDSDGQAKPLQSFWGEKKKVHMDEVAEDDAGMIYEEVKKDLNTLTKEEQMDVVHSSAPELVGLLAELNDALNELENKVKPLICKVKEHKNVPEGRNHYLEVKKQLLLTYCQAISFYLLLKSEGHPVHDHPVIARLVEIKNLLDKLKEMEGTLPSDISETFEQECGKEMNIKQPKEDTSAESESCSSDLNQSEAADEVPELAKVALSMDEDSKNVKSKHQIGLQSLKMMKVRESLEQKLKQRGLYGSVLPNSSGTQKQLETKDGFDDVDNNTVGHSLVNGHGSNKISLLVASKPKKPKFVSGDDDLPVRDDIGERRRKFEVRVLAKAGAAAMDDVEDEFRDPESDRAEPVDDEEDGDESLESEDEFYKEAKRQRDAKLSAKAALHSRTPAVPAAQEPELVDGKRKITYQMEKNKGLTRQRKKLTKIPRKKYKLKHQKAVIRRKGQVRDIRKPAGPYGGEASGIKTTISRSIRFKS